jgi:translation initiation factor 3 subunit A
VLEEKATLQRQREEEAEARRLAKKNVPAAAPVSERPSFRDLPARDQPSPAVGGPPKLNLAGAKPSWREREAMKAAGQAPPAPTSAAGPAPPATAPETEPPKRGGYVPPALRNRNAESPAGGWREREGSGRGPAGRNESPAAASGGRYEAPGRGRFSELGDKTRNESPASGGNYVPPSRRGFQQDGARGRETDREPESESAPPPAQAPSGGKYRPGAFRRTGA